MKDYNHLSFQTNNRFPSTQATEQASLFVKTEKTTQNSARKIQFRYFADVQFFPKYVAAIMKTRKKTKTKPNNGTITTKKVVVIMYMPSIYTMAK